MFYLFCISVSKKWSDSDMASAVSAVVSGMSVRKAAAEFNVPKSSLSDRVTGRVKPGSTWGKKSKLSSNDEVALLKAATTRADKGVGFTKGNFLRYVGIFADQKGNAFKRGVPSDMWWRRLKARHADFSLRSTEATGANRHDAMTRSRLNSYFSDLKGVLDTFDFHSHPERVWNMDETGVQMTHKPHKVLATKGTKTVHGKASVSRETITVIACGNAAGQAISPYFIMPGKTTKKLHGFDTESCTDRASPLYGAKFSVSETGWTKEGIGRLWFTDHFLPNIGPARPQLLIFDGHGSHNNTEFIRVAREQNIVLGELPSHTSHWTQPFDRAVFKSLKNSWNTHVDNYIKNTGIPLGNSSFLRVFTKAWSESFTADNIISRFRATGIHPFNPSAIPDAAFAPTDKGDAASINDVATTVNINNGIPTLETAVPVALGPGPAEMVDTANAEYFVATPVTDSASASFAASPAQTIATPASGNDLFALDVLNIQIEQKDEAEAVLDLPLHVSSEGVVTELSHESMESVDDKTALDVIESAICPETLAKYLAAFLSGSKVNDTVYETWHMYKTRCMKKVASPQEVLDLNFPLPIKTGKKKKKRVEKKPYFVISADEIFKEKVAKEEEKRQKLVQKELRKVERERKKEIKMLQNCVKKLKKTK